MSKLDVATIISLEFVRRDVKSVEELLADVPHLRHELKYHNEAINRRLKRSFDEWANAMQNIINAYSEIPYKVKPYVPLKNDEDLENNIAENKEILNAMKKVLDFVK